MTRNEAALAILLFPIWAAAQPGSGLPLEVQPLPTLAPLVETVKAAVVNVNVQLRGPVSQEVQKDDVWQRLYGTPGPLQQRPRLRPAAGSGFIVDQAGLIATNNHVVEGAVFIRVTLNDGREFDAEVVGRDPATDVALIRIKGKVQALPAVRFGNSDHLRVGDWVVAIGNPFGLASSVSAGIISARAREIGAGQYDEFLQTDAAINPGNSGGPLFNLKGEVVGINTAIVGNGTGIGFAVPSNLARVLLAQLQRTGHVTRAYLGLFVEDLPPEVGPALGVPTPDGALVLSTERASPGERAGVRPDDVVVELDGQPIATGSALTRAVALKRPGSNAKLVLYRGPKREEVNALLGMRPESIVPDIPLRSGMRGNGDTAEQGAPQRLKIGLSYVDIDADTARELNVPQLGALIVDVLAGSPAERAELRPGMVVVEAGGRMVRRAEDLTRAIRASGPGSRLLVRVHRPGTPQRNVRAIVIPK
ncbi:MAG: trypsin-like peptidase domain-containing protein [Myxococcaceae bacterium]